MAFYVEDGSQVDIYKAALFSLLSPLCCSQDAPYISFSQYFFPLYSYAVKVSAKGPLPILSILMPFAVISPLHSPYQS